MLFLPEEHMGTWIYAQASQRPPRRERLYQGATGQGSGSHLDPDVTATKMHAEGIGGRLGSNRFQFRQAIADPQVRHRPSGVATDVSRFRD